MPADLGLGGGAYASYLARVLRAVADRPLPEAATFGILLSHKYTLSGVSEAYLKGADKILHATLLRARYSVTIRPVAYRAHLEVHRESCNDCFRRGARLFASLIRSTGRSAQTILYLLCCSCICLIFNSKHLRLLFHWGAGPLSWRL
jgi:hypothetical protein